MILETWQLPQHEFVKIVIEEKRLSPSDRSFTTNGVMEFVTGFSYKSPDGRSNWLAARTPILAARQQHEHEVRAALAEDEHVSASVRSVYSDIADKLEKDEYVAPPIQMNKILKNCGVPKRFFDCRWETFDLPTDDKSDKADEMIKDLAAVEKWGDDWTGVCFVSGPPGTGKTHTAVATLARWIEVNKTSFSPIGNELIHFRVIGELLQDIKNDFGTPDSGLRIKAVMECGMLFLDDLGSEMATEWVKDIVYTIINHRYSEELPTMLTSNLTLNTIGTKYHARLASRLACGLAVDFSYFKDHRIAP